MKSDKSKRTRKRRPTKREYVALLRRITQDKGIIYSLDGLGPPSRCKAT